MKYIDTHAHISFSDYDVDRENVIQHTLTTQTMVINVGIDEASSLSVVDLANQYEHLYAIMGLHPIHSVISDDNSFSAGEMFNPAFYTKLFHTSTKIVGIGECGFDYVHNPKESKTIQEKAFRAQIELACELDLPLMLHIRPSFNSFDAYEDALEILREYKKQYPTLRGQSHFFAGTPDIARAFLDLDFYISFTGVITFAESYIPLVETVPLDRLLSETDAPYVAPVPYRGRRNEPAYVQEIVKKMADIKGVSEDALAKQIMENARTLYRL